jgi:hypothetical protein
MAQILITEEGKRVQIEPSKDTNLYDAPHNPPNTGTAFTRGTDLYAHKARSGQMYFYTYSWSMWQGEESDYELVTREEAIAFLQERASYTGHDELSSGEMDQAREVFGEDIFAENA